MYTRLSLLFLAVLIIGLSACKKNNDAPAATALITSLNLINASADTVNFYLNGTRLTKSNIYPAGSSGYFNPPFGEQNYQVKDIFDPAGSTVRTLFSKTLTLDTAKLYSFFIVDNKAENAFLTDDSALQKDTVPNSCYVRFVNASPDDGAYDFAVSTVKYTNQAFKAASEFKLVALDSTGKVPLNLYHAGSSTFIISGNYILLIGKSYTFYTKGKADGKDNSALSVGVTLNYN